MRDFKKTDLLGTAGALATAVFCTVLIANVPTLSAGKGNGKGGGGGDGSETPSVLPIAALFETTGEDGSARITMDGSALLTDDGLDNTNGHSHLAQTGNYTIQLGGGRGKKTTASDRTLTFDFSSAITIDSPGDLPAGNALALDELFMAMNRKYCRDDDDSDPNTCPASDQWFNSASDGSQPGLRDMTDGQEVPVSLSLSPREGPDYRMYCSESSNDTFGTSASDVTEFAMARCVAEANGACQRWAIRGTDRNGDGAAMNCGLWLDGSRVGVFNMDFRLQLCLEDVNGGTDCTAPWPL